MATPSRIDECRLTIDDSLRIARLMIDEPIVLNRQSSTVNRLDLQRLPDDARHDPALAPAERPRFHDGDLVAQPGGVLLVVRHELGRTLLGFAVHAVSDLGLDGHDTPLVHLVAHDGADFFCLCTHTAESCGSRSTVRMP